MQADCRFFAKDCTPREFFASSEWVPPEPVGRPANSASPDSAGRRTEFKGEVPAYNLPDDHGRPSPYADPFASGIAPNREGLAAVLPAEDAHLNMPTPELLDLLRYRQTARTWTERHPQGQAEFIWACYNTTPCQQCPDKGRFLDGWCTPEEKARFFKNKGMDNRHTSVQAGDILIMMTARCARRMMEVIAELLMFHVYVFFFARHWCAGGRLSCAGRLVV